MPDTTDSPAIAPTEPHALGPAIGPDHAIAPWVLRAMERADQAGIDPRRVGIALGIPLRMLSTIHPPDDDGPGG